RGESIRAQPDVVPRRRHVPARTRQRAGDADAVRPAGHRRRGGGMSVLLDEETVVLEGLDFEVRCIKGEHSADVYVECRGCTVNAGYMCAGHLAQVRMYIEEIMSDPILTPLCFYCRRSATSFDTAYRVVP